MPQQFSLLVGPLARSVRPPQRLWVGGRPADQSVPDQPIIPQYAFRRGKFFQLQNRLVLPEIPADIAIPNAPVLRGYVFRVGGFWQTSKLLTEIDAVLPPYPYTPDQPIVPQYVFRKGRLWQVTKVLGTDIVIVPPPPPPPPPPATTGVVGGMPYRTRSLAFLDLSDPHWRPKLRDGLTKEDILLLYSIDALDEADVMALLEWLGD